MGIRITHTDPAHLEDLARHPARGKLLPPRDARGQQIHARSLTPEAPARSATSVNSVTPARNVGVTIQLGPALHPRKCDSVPLCRPSCSFPLLPLTYSCITLVIPIVKSPLQVMFGVLYFLW